MYGHPDLVDGLIKFRKETKLFFTYEEQIVLWVYSK